jgi:(4-(4-[2-(gamma-L-glutamylamino)ethyl]phenoxymethyl)furan-2-yl)methanamine synthase
MNCLAFDIGGANVKFSDGLNRTGCVPLALWQSPQRLAEVLRGIVATSPSADVMIGVTMTGELADCFPTKSAGVRHILAAVGKAADGLPVQVYLVDGQWASLESAGEKPLLAAASNWHALAQFAARYASAKTGLLLDIGSTTCDLIPLADGRPVAQGKTDTQRLLAGELVYTGIERSPVCAVLGQVPYRGRVCPVAQELFATMRDVYLVLGELPEQAHDTQTADGRPATRAAAIGRLARVICADESEFGEQDARELAVAAADAQAEHLAAAFGKVAGRLNLSLNPAPARQSSRVAETGLRESAAGFCLVLSGHGDCLARRVLARVAYVGDVVSLADRLGIAASRAATAYALAVLQREEFER